MPYRIELRGGLRDGVWIPMPHFDEGESREIRIVPGNTETPLTRSDCPIHAYRLVEDAAVSHFQYQGVVWVRIDEIVNLVGDVWTKTTPLHRDSRHWVRINFG